MIDKLYGIDYNTYVCGGIGLCKILKVGQETQLFYNESDMFKALAELKTDRCIGEIKLFTTPIIREKYTI